MATAKRLFTVAFYAAFGLLIMAEFWIALAIVDGGYIFPGGL